jgi:hypothetical protein
MVMAVREPEQAGTYAELLRSIAAALAAREVEGEDARDLRAVIDDVERVVKSLTP